MDNNEKADIILKYLDQVISVDWNMENYYKQAIAKALKEIEKQELAQTN